MSNGIERKLCAILAADVVGYSDLMHRDEVGTIRALKESREIVDGIIEDYGGRIIFTAGDSVVAEFPSAGNSVLCAQDMQLAMDKRNSRPHDGPDMLFRVGLNVGDVVINEDDLLGEGVNIAARLEALADHGGVFLSGSVYDQIEFDAAVSDKLEIESIGLKELKNISEPVRVYRLIKSERTQPARPRSMAAAAGAAAAALHFETADGPTLLVIGAELALGRAANSQVAAVGVRHRQVSRVGKQASIRFSDGTFALTDLDSANGTLLDDMPIAPGQTETMAFPAGVCEISLGGGRQPPRKGLCRLRAELIDAASPALRLSLDRSGLEGVDAGDIAVVWPGLDEDMRRTWVLGTGSVILGGGSDCALCLPALTDPAARVSVDRVEGGFALSPVGMAEATLNGTPLGPETSVNDGDILELGGISIAITTVT